MPNCSFKPFGYHKVTHFGDEPKFKFNSQRMREQNQNKLRHFWPIALKTKSDSDCGNRNL